MEKPEIRSFARRRRSSTPAARVCALFSLIVVAVAVCALILAGVCLATTGVSLQVPATQQWTDTGIYVNQGDTISITASGEITADNIPLGPDADPSSLASPPNYGDDPAMIYPLPGIAVDSLIGRIGGGAAFKVGSNYQVCAGAEGELCLGINEMPYMLEYNEGAWTAEVSVVTPAAPTVSITYVSSPAFDTHTYFAAPGGRVSFPEAKPNQSFNLEDFNFSGDRDTSGDRMTVRWTATGWEGNVSIDLGLDGAACGAEIVTGTWLHIADVPVSAGTFSWRLQVPLGRHAKCSLWVGTGRPGKGYGEARPLEDMITWGAVFTTYDGVNVYCNFPSLNNIDEFDDVYWRERYQCAELAQRFCYEKQWEDSDGKRLPQRWDNVTGASAMWTQAAAYGLHCVENTASPSEAPRTGELLIWGLNGRNHVAVISGVTSSSVTIVEQNASRSGVRTLSRDKNGHIQDSGVTGWVSNQHVPATVTQTTATVPSTPNTYVIPTGGTGGGGGATGNSSWMWLVLPGLLLAGGILWLVLAQRRSQQSAVPSGLGAGLAGGGAAVVALVTSNGSRCTLRQGVNTVGRASASDIFIGDPRASRNQAEIVVDSNGVVVRDLGSSYGTQVNGESISGDTVLHSGDQITIGNTTMTLV